MPLGPVSVPHMIPRSVRGWQEQSGHTDAVPLAKTVDRYVTRGAAGRFRCLIIAAHRGDGITTVAHMARQIAVGAGRTHHVAGEDWPRLAIVDALSPRVVIRAAVRAGVDPSRGTRRRWGVGLLGTVAVILLTAGTTMFSSVVGSGGAPTPERAWAVLTSPWHLLAALVAGLVAVAGDEVLNLPSGDADQRLDRISSGLGSAPRHNRERFIESLVSALLVPGQRRCLIVDDYARLDSTSQQVLRRALRGMPAGQGELWIVVESARPRLAVNSSRGAAAGDRRQWSAPLLGELGSQVVAERGAHPGGQPTSSTMRSYATLLFELLPLTPDERERLAAMRPGSDVGRDRAAAGQGGEARDAANPGNPGYFLVKEVLQGAATDADRQEFTAAWPPEEVIADGALHDALHLLYLLSVSAPPGRAVTFGLRELPAELAGTGPQREMLRLLLEVPPTVDTLRRRLDRATATFSRFLEEDRRRRPAVLRLSPAVQDVLTPRHASYRLPAPDRVHLFWALYRHDRTNGGRMASLETQVRHVREAADPTGTGSTAVSSAFGTALLASVDACLDLGAPGVAGALLDRAYDLAAEPGFPLDPVALRRRARSGYAVAADPGPLRRAAEQTPADVGGGDPLVELLEQTLPEPSGPSSLTGPGGLSGLAAVDPAIGTDLRLRAAWLALSIEPLVTGTRLPHALPLAWSIGYAHRALPLLTRDALREADTLPSGEWSPAPLASAATALWCLALTDDSSANDLVHQALDALTRGRRLARDTLAVHSGYLRHGTGHDLLVVVAAAAIQIRTTWNALAGTHRDQVEQIILDACRDLGITPPRPSSERLTARALADLAAAVATRMSSIQATWMALGYPRTAAVLNSRRVQFLAGRPVGNRSTRPKIGDRGHRDLLGLIANLAVAGDAHHHRSVGAEVLAATVARLLAAGDVGETLDVGESLTAQLCLLAVLVRTDYTPGRLRPHLDYLLQPGSDGADRGRLDPLLAVAAEDELDSLFLMFINAATYHDDQAAAIVEVLRRRLATVEDADTAELLHVRLDLYELQRKTSVGETLEVATTLDAWQHRRHLPVYAYVLCLLAVPAAGPVADRWEREASTVLRDPERYLGETGILLLANSVAHAAAAGRLTFDTISVSDVIAVLRTGLGRTGRRSALSLDSAIESARHLIRLDSGNTARYYAALMDLLRDKLRLVDEQRLTRLLALHNYSELLRIYVRLFEGFIGVDDGPPGSATAAFTDPGRRVLNTRFLSDLFGDGVPAAPAAVTRDALLRVLVLLAGQPDMPADMAELLRQHHDRIARLTRPDVPLGPTP